MKFFQEAKKLVKPPSITEAVLGPGAQLINRTVEATTGRNPLDELQRNIKALKPITNLPKVNTDARAAALESAISKMNAVPDAGTITAGQITGIPDVVAAQMGPIANIGVGPESRFVSDQSKFIQALQAQAAGTGGPSPAALMLQQAQDENMRNQMAMAASMSGRALPAAQRQIMQQQAMGGQEAARQMAILRAQEQLQAQELLGSTMGTARGQDIQQTGLGLEASKSNQATALATAQANLLAKQKTDTENANRQLDIQRSNIATDLERQRIQETVDLERQRLIEEHQKQVLEQRAAMERAILQAKTAEQQAKAGIVTGVTGGLLQASGALAASAAGGK